MFIRDQQTQPVGLGLGWFARWTGFRLVRPLGGDLLRHWFVQEATAGMVAVAWARPCVGCSAELHLRKPDISTFESSTADATPNQFPGANNQIVTR